ncbi:unnamed protein product, partial [Arctia plantaginis]
GEIKETFLDVLNKLRKLVADSEAECEADRARKGSGGSVGATPVTIDTDAAVAGPSDSGLSARLDEHSRLLLESNERMKVLQEQLSWVAEEQQRSNESVIAAGPQRPSRQTALHSVVVTSKDDMETERKSLEELDGPLMLRRSTNMSGFHTTAKDKTSSTFPSQATPPDAMPETSPTERTATQTTSRQIGELEASKVPSPRSLTIRSRITARMDSMEVSDSPTSTATKTAGRIQEARNWVTKAKIAIKNSRNLRTDIKGAVTQAIDSLYQLVKEAELGRRPNIDNDMQITESQNTQQKTIKSEKDGVSQLFSSLADHSRLMRESSEKLDKLNEALEEKSEAITYATKWLNFEMDAPIKTIASIHLELLRVTAGRHPAYGLEGNARGPSQVPQTLNPVRTPGPDPDLLSLGSKIQGLADQFRALQVP